MYTNKGCLAAIVRSNNAAHYTFNVNLFIISYLLFVRLYNKVYIHK